MERETWMTAEEAKEYGFVDEILFEESEEVKIVANSSGMLPQNVVKKFQVLSGKLIAAPNFKLKKTF